MILILTSDDLRQNSKAPTDIDKISLWEDFAVRDRSTIESASIVVYIINGKFKILKNRFDEYETIRLLKLLFGELSIFQFS